MRELRFTCAICKGELLNKVTDKLVCFGYDIVSKGNDISIVCPCTALANPTLKSISLRTMVGKCAVILEIYCAVDGLKRGCLNRLYSLIETAIPVQLKQRLLRKLGKQALNHRLQTPRKERDTHSLP